MLVIDRCKLGVSITRSTMNFLRSRCHVLFFSSTLNSPNAVRDNIVNMFTVCAKRLHIHFHSTKLSRIYRNEKFISTITLNCILYGAALVCSSLARRKKLRLGDGDSAGNVYYLLDDHLPVNYDEVCDFIRRNR